MYKKILLIVMLSLIIGIIVFGLLHFISNPKKLLIDVMNSKETFIDESSNKILFKDYKIAGIETAKAEKYTFVDLDKDGIDELAVFTTADYGAYMIFRYDKETKNVYGYMIGVRSFQDVKVDGTFKGSGGADTTSYFEITFNNNNKQIITKAIDDGMLENYEIDNVKVSENEINKYVDSWNNKENCIWINDEIIIEENNSENQNDIDKFVGIYHNNNWNGKEATLRLNKDGSYSGVVYYSKTREDS